MRIVNNGYSIEVKNIEGQKCLSLIDFANLDGHCYTEICRKVKYKPILKSFIVRSKGCEVKKTHLTIEGCIILCKMFQFPNDELIKKLTSLVEKKKPTAEEFIDKELENFGLIRDEVVNPKDFNWIQPVKELKELIEKIDNRLLDVENNLSYLNDKPNQSSFKDLLKECIKEIIREELCK